MEMLELTDGKREDLKKQVATSTYVVDPRQVAAVVIARLALSGPASSEPVQGGPSRAKSGPGPARPAV
jgi:hypothetical protein